MRLRLVGLLAPVALLCSVGCFGGEDSSNGVLSREEGGGVPARSWAGTEAAPEFPSGLAWFNVAQPLTLEGLRGKAVLLDFWTQGCINCQHIIPDLKRLEDEFGDTLVVVGVHSGKYDREHDDASVRDAILKYGIEHPVVNDPDFAFWRTYGADAWPTLALVDPAGNLVGRHAGEGVYPLFQPILASLIAEFDGAGLVDRTPLPVDPEASTLPATVLAFPSAVLADAPRDRLYIADSGHNRMVVTRLDGWVVDTIGTGEEGFADGSFDEAAFREPQGLALSANGNTLYVADTRNHALRAVDLVAGSVTTLAGTGQQLERFPAPGAAAKETALASPWGLWRDGATLYVGMAGVHQIWALDLASSTVTVFAGTSREGIDDGRRLGVATLAQPSGLAADGRYLYWVDPESSSVRRVSILGEGEVETIVGTGLFDFGDRDGIGKDVLLEHPQGIALYEGDVYIADTYNHKVKRVSPSTGEAKTIAGDGSQGWADGLGAQVRFNEPGGLGVAGDTLYIADTNNHLVRTLDLETGQVATLTLSNVGVAAPAAAAGQVTLPGQTVAPGEANLRITFRAPEGLKLNATGPAQLELATSDPAIAELSETHLTWSTSEPVIEIPVPVALMAGSATITATASIPFCREGEEALCFIETVRLVLPLVVEASAGGGDPAIAYDLSAP